ncbi:MAG: TetR/AcrR family transcriptional regulator [Cyclobacteriaceae bacterium]
MKKDTILASALELIQKFGLSSLTMDDVARHCGISKKTIYQFFSGKDALIDELTDAFIEDEQDRLTQALEQLPSPADQFRFMITFLFNIIEVIPYENLFVLKRKHHASYALFESFFHSVKHTLGDIVANGLEEGLFDQRIKKDIFVENTVKQLFALHKDLKRMGRAGVYEIWKEQLFLYLTKVLYASEQP